VGKGAPRRAHGLKFGEIDRVGFATLSPPYALEREQSTRSRLMPAYLGALAVVLLLGMVLSRVFLLRRLGIVAMKFGEIDKTDFLIPPVMQFYFYLVFAHAFGWPSVARGQLLHSVPIAWAGVAACAAATLRASRSSIVRCALIPRAATSSKSKSVTSPPASTRSLAPSRLQAALP